jgi:chloramphenicol O-acetyltransferase
LISAGSIYKPWCFVANAANKVPELRRRIAGDGIIEYSYCNTSHTVALEDGTYCYFEQNNRILMPTTILVNHALADGKHIAEFYGNLDEIMTQLIAGLQV